MIDGRIAQFVNGLDRIESARIEWDEGIRRAMANGEAGQHKLLVGLESGQIRYVAIETKRQFDGCEYEER